MGSRQAVDGESNLEILSTVALIKSLTSAKLILRFHNSNLKQMKDWEVREVGIDGKVARLPFETGVEGWREVEQKMQTQTMHKLESFTPSDGIDDTPLPDADSTEELRKAFWEG
ncbi:hypothetical protein FOZ62_004470, partial [Perkinsus olseni]